MTIEFSPANAEYILKRDHRTCCYCGYTSLTPIDILLDGMTGGDIQIDHFIARVNGGKGTRKNGKVSCVFCNGCKGNAMLGTDYWPAQTPIVGTSSEKKDFIIQNNRRKFKTFVDECKIEMFNHWANMLTDGLDSQTETVSSMFSKMRKIRYHGSQINRQYFEKVRLAVS
jgi:5-methylcytosine-specific restriction endonuclease McrA